MAKAPAAASTPASSGMSTPKMLDKACCAEDPSSFTDRISTNWERSDMDVEDPAIASECSIDTSSRLTMGTQLIEPNLIKTVLKHNNRTTHHTNKAHLIIFHPIFQGYSYYAPSINHNLKKSFAHLFIKVIVAQFMSVSL